MGAGMWLLRLLGKLLAAVFMLMLGTLFIAAGVYGLHNTSTHFEPIEATILSAEPRVTRGSINNTNSRRTVIVSLSYAYTINGARFLGQGNLGVAQANSSREAEQQLAAARAHFMPGGSVAAFVDPDDSTRSVLKRRGVIWAIPALVFGVIVLMTLSGVMVMSGWEWWLRRSGRAGGDSSNPEKV